MFKSVTLFILGLFFSVVAFFMISYFDSFVTKASYNEDKAEIKVIKKDIEYIKIGIDEIKRFIYEK